MPAQIREAVFNPTTGLIVLVVLLSCLFGCYELQAWPFGDHRTVRDRYRFQRVSRTILEPSLRAPGRVESSRRTVVRCELENMATTTGSASAGTSGGSSTIIWVIPEGTAVNKGDVLARLDASTYEEMLRQQTIVVEQAKASHLQAQLNLEIAKIALREYLEGTVQETRQQMEANLSLARSNLTQAAQRLEWTRKMNQKGYASIAQVETDKQSFITTELALQQQESSYNLFKRFTLPKNEKSLQADITTAQTTLDSEQVKMNRQVERFELLKKQVERCTLRAPNDGVVYYYVDPNPRRGSNQDTEQILEGMAVRQEQKLFFLPDLDEMEVQVVLNESIVSRVSPGLSASVEFEGLPEFAITGKLTSISEIPNQTNRRGEDVRSFMGVVKLDRSAPGLKPSMSAIVSLTLPKREATLAVPHEAVVADQGRYECYVPVGDHLEPRDVKLGKATPELIEITEGLTEGQEIALNPPAQGNGRPRSLAGFDARSWPAGPVVKLESAPQAGPAPAAGPGNRQGPGGRRRQKGAQSDNPIRRSRKRASNPE